MVSTKPLTHVAGTIETAAAKAAKPKRAPRAPKPLVANTDLLPKAQQLQAEINALKAEKRAKLLTPFRAIGRGFSAVSKFIGNDIKKTGEDITAVQREVKRHYNIVDWNINLHKKQRAEHAAKNNGKTTLGMKFQALRDGINQAGYHPINTLAAGLKTTGKAIHTGVQATGSVIGRGIARFNEALAKREAAINAKNAIKNAERAQRTAEKAKKDAEKASINEWNAGVRSRAKAAQKARTEAAKAATAQAETEAKKQRAIAEAPRKALRKTMREQQINQIKFDTRRAVVATGNGIATVAKKTAKGASTVAEVTGKKAAAVYEGTGAKAYVETSRSLSAKQKALADLQKQDRTITKTNQEKAQAAARQQAQAQAEAARNEQIEMLNQQLTAITETKAGHATGIARQQTILKGIQTKAQKGQVGPNAGAKQRAEIARAQAEITRLAKIEADLNKKLAKLMPKAKPAQAAVAQQATKADQAWNPTRLQSNGKGTSL